MRSFLSTLLATALIASGCGAQESAKKGETQGQGESTQGDDKAGKDSGSQESEPGDGGDQEDGGDQDPKNKENPGEEGKDGGSSGPKAIGDTCERDEECASAICREVSVVNPLDGGTIAMKTCATCRDDESCKAKSQGIACVVMLKTGGSSPISASYQCGDGGRGSSCEKAEHCQAELKCSAISVQGKAVEFKTCGECESDADCPEAAPLCSSEGATQLRPFNRCIAEGGKQDGEICSGEGEEGNRECANYCRTFAGLVSLCVPCIEDAHCAAGERCAPEELNPTNPAASKLPECVAK